ncbi:glycosyltransferase [Chryseobacterium piperi]|uniref:Glycosyltransferase n=1 Tax=Chryseobacterium piperi TaxID=558152 RepID=A0A086BMV1_9FLAO|nr:glycosyltransferase family A protein [Chryseobacterium piperi]ASW75059.1 glycosyltransferase family 2 protein [Chryseobacterium piperi]KFF30265.1 glycosyltransferase [Chryseobacterium piperi]
MKLFTIFTPTYNRSILLDRLFKSLCNQTIRNFEWLIVDDGSTDDTEEVITNFTKSADFPIRYIKQKNQGKHIAINTGIKNAQGKWYLPIDSDDFLGGNALEICQNLALEAENKEFGGFTFIHAPEEMYGKDKINNTNKRVDSNYEWDFAGEMVYAFKMEIIRKYPFPVFENEKFCQESVQLIPIIKNYKILYTDHILAFGEYLEDGLSQNLYQRLLDNPNYAMLALKTKLIMAKSRDEKKMITKNYWDIALKTKQSKIKTFFNFPFSLNYSYFKLRFFQKLKA